MHGHQPRHCRGSDLRPFLAAWSSARGKLKVGDGMQPGIEIGPCVDQGQMETDLRYIEIGTQGSGRARSAAAGVSPEARYDKGYFVEPTMFADVTEKHTHRAGRDLRPGAGRDARQRFRGCHAHRQQHPVRPFILHSDDQSIARLRVSFIAREAGLLTVNLPSAGVEYQLPFGGTKESSFGPKEQGPAAMEFYSDLKTVYLKY